MNFWIGSLQIFIIGPRLLGCFDGRARLGELSPSAFTRDMTSIFKQRVHQKVTLLRIGLAVTLLSNEQDLRRKSLTQDASILLAVFLVFSLSYSVPGLSVSIASFSVQYFFSRRCPREMTTLCQERSGVRPIEYKRRISLRRAFNSSWDLGCVGPSGTSIGMVPRTPPLSDAESTVRRKVGRLSLPLFWATDSVTRHFCVGLRPIEARSRSPPSGRL